MKKRIESDGKVPAAKGMKLKAKGRKGKTDTSESYNKFKEFEGQRYTGMKVGRSHYWNYDAGQWKETKITPDEWQIHFAVTKRRKGKAPEGSGAPVGTAYHWYILAHQVVEKLNANDYSTEMTGVKYKLAHRRAATGKWSASDAAQRRNLVKLLKGFIADLEKEPEMIRAPEPAVAQAKVKSPRVPRRKGAKMRRREETKSVRIH